MEWKIAKNFEFITTLQSLTWIPIYLVTLGRFQTFPKFSEILIAFPHTFFVIFKVKNKQAVE